HQPAEVPGHGAGGAAVTEGHAVRTPGLDDGLDALHTVQLGTGEMLAYGREPAGGLTYVRSPLFSTYVHDALGCFDPRSPAWEERTLGLVDLAARGRFVRAVGWLRRRIRGYLAWQADPGGTWRFFGRASGLPADPITTARPAGGGGGRAGGPGRGGLGGAGPPRGGHRALPGRRRPLPHGHPPRRPRVRLVGRGGPAGRRCRAGGERRGASLPGPGRRPLGGR